MKIFLDTANIKEILQYAFVIDGVTTNPTLMSQEKTGYNIREHIAEIARIVNGPISVETMSQTAPEIVREAEELATISPNVVIKIPMNEAGLQAAKILSAKKIKTNVTLIFSANQAFLAAKAGATYASIFVGRLDDIGHDGIDVVRDTIEIYRQHDFSTELITASVRHPLHVINAAKAGSHVITIPPKVLSLMFRHNLTDAGLKKFCDDWAQLAKNQGPGL
ncbi:fructose-6-phosphate aldolase [Methanoregula sp.]|uniref:fructose-6-phosphate aldolase n=1 Tax=Methanoregula sp. TaxID=2052170 RepID=UPI003563122D